MSRVFWLAGVQLELASPEVSLDLLAHFEGARDWAQPCFSMTVSRSGSIAPSAVVARVERSGPLVHYTSTNTHATLDLERASVVAAVPGPQALLGLLRLLLGVVLPEQGGLLLHAAAIEHSDDSGLTRGHVFLGASGAGKTTLAALAAQAGARVLGDEIVAVRVRDRRAFVYGTPLGSRGGCAGERGTATLASLCWLRQGPHHAFHQAPAGDAIAHLLARTVTSPEAVDANALLAVSHAVVTHACVGELTFARDPGFLSALPRGR